MHLRSKGLEKPSKAVMGSDANERWQWIQRTVEPTVEKWLTKRGSVVLTRGQRRSGKSSTVKHCARRLNKGVVTFCCEEDSVKLVENAQQSFNCNAINTQGDIKDAILKAIKSGKVVILEEIQNSSKTFQVALQQTCDDIAFETMHDPAGWRNAGCLFMMGSLPGLVDAIVENRKNPLFQRISAKITVYQMNTLEMTRLFLLNLKISDPKLKLSLYSIFGGKPHPYYVGFSAGLFQGNNSNIEQIAEAYLSFELQQAFSDASDLCRIEFGEKLSGALKAVAGYKTLKEQEKECQCNYAFSVMKDELYLRYGVIESVYEAEKLCSLEIVRFDLVEPLLKLATSIAQKHRQVSRVDVARDLTISEDILRQQEAFAWQRWVVEIAQDRRQLCMEPCFPFLENNDTCTFCPKLVWPRDVEIDVVAGHPSTNTLIVGSCKRSSAQICNNELLGHVERLKAKRDAWQNILAHLSLRQDTLQMRYYHFVPEVSEQDRDYLQKLQEECNNAHVVDLQMLLDPFEDIVRQTAIDPAANDVMGSSGAIFTSASTSGDMSPAVVLPESVSPPHSVNVCACKGKHREKWLSTTCFSIGVASCALAVYTMAWLFIKRNR